MVKVAENRRAAVLPARVLLVCSLFTIGLAPRGRADDVQSYQYTLNSIPQEGLSSSNNLQMSLYFVLPSLLSDFQGSINLGDVVVTQAPSILAPTGVLTPAPTYFDTDYSYSQLTLRLVSLTVGDTGFGASFQYQIPCGGAEVCAPDPSLGLTDTYRWQGVVNYSERFDEGSPIGGPGLYTPFRSQQDIWTNGNGPLGMSHNISQNMDTISVLATPEPNTGLLVGAIALLGAVVLRRRIRIAY